MNKEVTKTNPYLETIRNILIGNKAFFIVIIFCIVLSMLTPIFYKPDNLINVIRQVCVSALLSIGFTVVIASGNIDLSVGTLLGLCGVIAAKLMKADVPIIISIIIVLAIAIFCGSINAFLISKFRLNFFIVTLATQLIFKGANYLLSELTPISGLPKSFVVIGQGYWGPIPIPVYIVLFFTILVWILINKTQFGRYVLAIGGNEEAARVSGISINKMIFGVFGISAFCAGVAGIVMAARTASAQVSAGIGMEMDAITAVVIGGTSLSGGKANIWGTLFGCLLIGVLNNGMNLLGVNTSWQVVAKGALILVAVISDTIITRSYAAQMNRKLTASIAAEQVSHA